MEEIPPEQWENDAMERSKGQEKDGSNDESQETKNQQKRSLDVFDYFLFNDCKFKVEIIWENGFPFFRASDLAKILGLKNIHASIAKYGPNQKVLKRIETPGGFQDAVFLTEVGVSKLFNRSDKPMAMPFQEWVANVIRDIQRDGKYETSGDLTKKLRIDEDTIRQEKHKALVEAYDKKPVVYYGRIKETNGKILMKIGSTIDIKQRAVQLKDYFGSIFFFHVIECGNCKMFEQHLLKHHMILPFAYLEPVGRDGQKSREVFLVTEEEKNRAIEVSKRNVSRYKKDPAAPEDLYAINEKLQKQEEEIRNLKALVAEKEVAKEKEEMEKMQSEPSDDRKHTQAKGDKIQRYSPDGKILLETYASYMDALRDNKIDSPSRAQMKLAANGNFIYKGFRWAQLDRALPDETVQELEETRESQNVRKGLVAMLNLKQTEIVKVFGSQKQAAEDREFSGCAAISAAIKRGSQSGGHYFKMWFDCTEEMKAAYLENNELPTRLVTGKANKVQQTGKDGKTRIFPCIQDVQKEYGVGRKKLTEAIENGIVLRGFLWSWVG